MRLFIAVDLPDGVRDALSELQRTLRASTNSARWVAPESIHITLNFLGEVADKRLEEINGALADLAWKPFTVVVKGVGFFPGTRSPRIFWAGLDAPTMESLASETGDRMERIGFEQEKRAFRPHITLARSRDARLDTALISAAAEYSDRDFGSFSVDRIFLFKSTLKSSGAVYEKVREYSL
jgi:RNA 2',3'-cyclic 3'-phosphodiesterase